MKLLEKGPLSRLRIVQRFLHRRRRAQQTGNDKYKTFEKNHNYQSASETDHIVEHEVNDLHPEEEELDVRLVDDPETEKKSTSRMKTSQTENDISTAPNRLTAARRHSDGDLPLLETDEGEPESSAKPKLTLSERVEQSKGSAARIKAWELSHDVETQPLAEEHNNEQQTSVKRSLSLHRNSKLRSSLRELKRRSTNQVNQMKESLRRKPNPKKYDNLDSANKEEDIVELEKSPGARRRQVRQNGSGGKQKLLDESPEVARKEETTATGATKGRQLGELSSGLRRSLRRSGRYAVQALSNLPTVSVAQGLAKMSVSSTMSR